MSAIANVLEALRAGTSEAASARAPDRAEFATQGRLAAEGLRLSVAGHGPLKRPLGAAAASALAALCRPARFGLREQTLLDSGVRDTGEIAAADLTLDWMPPGARPCWRSSAAAPRCCCRCRKRAAGTCSRKCSARPPR